MTAKMLDEFVKLILCYKLKWIHSDSSVILMGQSINHLMHKQKKIKNIHGSLQM